VHGSEPLPEIKKHALHIAVEKKKKNYYINLILNSVAQPVLLLCISIQFVTK
jgi:hypothetical protein